MVKNVACMHHALFLPSSMRESLSFKIPNAAVGKPLVPAWNTLGTNKNKADEPITATPKQGEVQTNMHTKAPSLLRPLSPSRTFLEMGHAVCTPLPPSGAARGERGCALGGWWAQAKMIPLARNDSRKISSWDGSLETNG